MKDYTYCPEPEPEFTPVKAHYDGGPALTTGELRAALHCIALARAEVAQYSVRNQRAQTIDGWLDGAVAVLTRREIA